MKAYDITYTEDRDAADGWCYGYGPNITPRQWPRGRFGLPMCHRFTLRLPTDYRRAGQEFVAVSVFDDEDDEMVLDQPDLTGMPAYEAHPRDNRMEDIREHAVLWLTEAEFSGPRCPPPMPEATDQLRRWMQLGSAQASRPIKFAPADDLPPEWEKAIRLVERPQDPNVGVSPPAGLFYDKETPDGYQMAQWFDADDVWHEAEWSKGRPDSHLGGTMEAIQQHPSPAFSPWFIGLGEDLGGFNFGGGAGQIDLESMRIDWAQ